jgi:UDP-N-acetylmuramate--alanine ligase
VTVPADLDLATPRRVHVVGVGGAGMSGLARLLAGLGHTVTGSDLVDSPTAAALRDAGIPVAVGHDAANVGDVDLVTASPAVALDNAELVAAVARGIRVATRGEVLGALAVLREVVAIAGTHGKTTTSSMLTRILATAGRAPSWLVGADVAGLGANARLDVGPELVVEADESYGSFAHLSPALCAVTNVEADHLDHYGTVEALHDAFASLLARAGTRVVNADDPVAARLGRRVGARSVGTAVGSDLRLGDVRLDRASSRFTLRGGADDLEVLVGAPGLHNVHNAAVAAATALERGVDGAAVVEALGRFAGVPRRFEFRGSFRGATVVDDYAHLPGEVTAVLDAARAGGFGRVVAVFQPHRYTRTARLAAEFTGAFDGADVLVVTDVYAAGEPPLPGVTGRLVADAVASGRDGPEVRYVKDRDDVAAVVAELVREDDLVLTMGAGDLTTLPDELRGLEP